MRAAGTCAVRMRAAPTLAAPTLAAPTPAAPTPAAPTPAAPTLAAVTLAGGILARAARVRLIRESMIIAGLTFGVLMFRQLTGGAGMPATRTRVIQLLRPTTATRGPGTRTRCRIPDTAAEDPGPSPDPATSFKRLAATAKTGGAVSRIAAPHTATLGETRGTQMPG